MDGNQVNAGVPPPEMEPQTGGLQTGIPGPPGIAPPLGPNNPNMPMMAFMQLMTQQMQTFMQSMQTQMQSQTAQTSSNSGSVQNRLDERCFRRLDRFSNKCDDWKEWRLHFLTVIGECNSKFSAFLKENERKEDAVDTDLDIPLEFVELSAQL